MLALDIAPGSESEGGAGRAVGSGRVPEMGASEWAWWGVRRNYPLSETPLYASGVGVGLSRLEAGRVALENVALFMALVTHSRHD